jgi:hypothetical protein
MTKEIVIAAYEKELDWVSRLNSDVKVTIYRKGDIIPLKENEIKISINKGRCVHTFFNHIYLNYDNLSDYTFFVQDFPFDHWGNVIDIINSSEEEIPKNASLTIGGYYGYHNNNFGTSWYLDKSSQVGVGGIISCQSNGHPQDLNPNIDVDKYWNILFLEDNNIPQTYEFMPGGHFVITKEQIKLRSRQFYKKIVELLEDDVNAPWMIERLECYIFNDKFKTIL